MFADAFPIRKGKPSRHDIVHIYHFKCISYSRRFENKARKQGKKFFGPIKRIDIATFTGQDYLYL